MKVLFLITAACYAAPQRGSGKVLLPAGHPPVTGDFPRSHPPIIADLNAAGARIPSDHPNIDSAIARGIPLPGGHPPMSLYVTFASAAPPAQVPPATPAPVPTVPRGTPQSVPPVGGTTIPTTGGSTVPPATIPTTGGSTLPPATVPSTGGSTIPLPGTIPPTTVPPVVGGQTPRVPASVPTRSPTRPAAPNSDIDVSSSTSFQPNLILILMAAVIIL